MSFGQRIDQYQSKYSCMIQNVLLFDKYKSFGKIKRLRKDFTFSELYYKL